MKDDVSRNTKSFSMFVSTLYYKNNLLSTEDELNIRICLVSSLGKKYFFLASHCLAAGVLKATTKYVIINVNMGNFRDCEENLTSIHSKKV